MHIGIIWDQRYTHPERMTGVGKHIVQVVQGLLQDPDLTCTVFVAGDQAVEEVVPTSLLGVRNSGRLPLRNSIRSLKWCPGKRRSLPVEVDVLYSPMELALWNSGVPMIPTLHGFPCFEEKLPASLYRSWRYRLERFHQGRLMNRLRRSGSKAFSVSQALADEAVERFGVDPENLVVVGNGVEEVFFAAELPERPGANAPLAQVGGWNAFDGSVALGKLLPHLQEKVERLDIYGDRHEEMKLKGSALTLEHFPGSDSQRENVQVLGLTPLAAPLVFKGFVSGDELRAGLRSSKALLFLPLCESFGITGLEALALGTPVIACKTGGVEEVLGDCAFWVESECPEQVLNALDQLDQMSDGEYCAWQEKGREHARSFSWKRVCRKVKEGLNTCV